MNNYNDSKIISDNELIISTIYYNDIKTVKNWIKDGININHHYRFKADYINYYYIKDCFISYGFDIEEENYNSLGFFEHHPKTDYTLLDLSVYFNKIRIVELLIDNGADVNITDEERRTPLHICSSYDMAKFLISKGAKVNLADKNGNTPLHNCSSYEMAKLLIENGADVNTKNALGRTLLHICSSYEIANLLINNGADINITDKYGDTPLLLATEYEIVKLLIKNGADIDKPNNDNITPLLSFVIYDDKKDITKLLINQGADVNSSDDYGYTPLFYATLFQNEIGFDIVKMLIDAGANVNVKMKINGHTSIFNSIQRNDYKTTEFLIKAGADLEVRSKENETPLSFAKKLGNEEIVKLLKEGETKE